MPLSKSRSRNLVVLLSLAFIATSFGAWAQSIPPAAETSRLIPDRQQEKIDLTKVKERKKKRVVSIAPAGAEKIVFVLKDIQVVGMTAYSQNQVAKLYDEYVGQKISVATVYKIAGRLQEKYIQDGYTISKVIVPEQNPANGHVKLQVIEGYVAEIEVNGNVRPGAVIDDTIMRLKAMRPLNTRELERLMLILNQLPGAKISAILASTTKPSTDPGAIRVILDGSPVQRVSGYANLNNYGSLYSGPWQATGTANIARLATDYDSISLTATTSLPTKELVYGSAKYAIPVFGASGMMFSVGGSAAHTAPGDTLEELDLTGNTRELSVGLSYPIWLQRERTWNVEADFTGKGTRMDIAGDRLYNDKLRVVGLNSSMTYADGWEGISAWDVGVSKGLNILGARETGSADLSRADGRSDFVKLNSTLGRRQALPRNFEFYGMVEGQYTNDPLLSSEEFGFGGVSAGRGYDPSEITGDKGVSASIELRYNKVAEKYQTVLQPYVFYDIGKIWNIDPDAKEKVSAASAGAGMRASISDDWALEGIVAFPLTRAADNPPHYTNPDGMRVLFSATKKF